MTIQEKPSDSDNLRKLYESDYVEHFEKKSDLHSTLESKKITCE